MLLWQIVISYYGIETVIPVMLQGITAASGYSLVLNVFLNELILFYKAHCRCQDTVQPPGWFSCCS